MKATNTYQLIKEFKFRDLEGIDHFRYFIEKNGELLNHTVTSSLEEAENWYKAYLDPEKPLPSKTTILETDIVEEEELDTSNNQLDKKLSKMMGFDINDLDDISINRFDIRERDDDEV